MGDTDETANFCGECGAPIRGGKFCTKCGTPSGFHQVITPEMVAAAAAGTEKTLPDVDPPPSVFGPPTASGTFPALDPTRPVEGPSTASGTFPASAPPAQPPGRRRSGQTWALIAGSGALLVIAAIALVVVLATSSDEPSNEQAARGPSPVRVYQEQVAKAFGPVLGANLAMSDKLVALKGTDRHDAQVAVRQAQQATTAATGALGAITVPTGQQELAQKAQQVLDREVAYLEAVASVLSRPTVSGSSQIQTLASNLTSALDAAGPAVAGEQPTVQGAGELTKWAHTTQRTLARRAKAKRDEARKARQTAAARGGSSAAAPAAPSSGTSCGGGLYAGPNTSCDFARNVREAYWEAPGSSPTVRVFSPVTGQTYTMHCAPSGSGTSCSGGNNASVTF